MTIHNYETHGRKLLVEFACRRCGKKETRPLEECMKETAECYNGLHDLNPPIGWNNGGFYYPIFCPDCKKAYNDFMNNKDCKRTVQE